MPGYATEEQGHRTRIGRSRPNIVIFWPFLAFKSRLGGLKDPLEVRVEVETCRTMDGTHLECILSRKNWTRSAGGVRNGQNRSESNFQLKHVKLRSKRWNKFKILNKGALPKVTIDHLLHSLDKITWFRTKNTQKKIEGKKTIFWQKCR